jgi:hypothetical protein
MEHVFHGDAQGVVVAEDGHAERITHEQEIDAGFVDETCCGVVVAVMGVPACSCARRLPCVTLATPNGRGSSRGPVRLIRFFSATSQATRMQSEQKGVYALEGYGLRHLEEERLSVREGRGSPNQGWYRWWKSRMRVSGVDGRINRP